jgi:DnaJ-class molecular chaperone
MTNYYNTLEINENATSEEIKKSYRKLSLKYHPDKNQNDPDAVKKFQAITEAYEVLGDKEKKQQYDMMQSNPFAKMMGSNMRGGIDPMEEIFSQFFGQGQGPGPGEMPFGFPFSFGGHGPGPNVQIFRNGVPMNMGQKPTPIIKNITITMEQVLSGSTIPVDIERWIIENGNKLFEKETLYVNIPKGVDDNEIILLTGKGNIASEKCVGDIKLFVKVDNNSDLKRRGLDLFLEKKITLKEALCGFTFDFKYLNGKNYTINNNGENIIPPGHKKIIPNMGLTREGHTGNLIIEFEIEFPKKLKEDVVKELVRIL